MKVSANEMSIIVAQVCRAKDLTRHESAILVLMGCANGAMIGVAGIVRDLIACGFDTSSSGSVRVLLHRIRKKIAGTGLSMRTSPGKGGGLVLRYDPAP